MSSTPAEGPTPNVSDATPSTRHRIGGGADVAHRTLRTILALAMFAGAAAALIWQAVYRGDEARLEAWLVRTFSSVNVVAQPRSATVWTGLGTNHITGFNVTPLCSSSYLVAGFCVITGLLLLVRRWRLSLVLTGVTVAAAVLAAANMVRLSVVIGATREWQQTGFEWAHTYIGTVISVIGLLTAAALYLMILGGHRRSQPSTAAS